MPRAETLLATQGPSMKTIPQNRKRWLFYADNLFKRKIKRRGQ